MSENQISSMDYILEQEQEVERFLTLSSLPHVLSPGSILLGTRKPGAPANPCQGDSGHGDSRGERKSEQLTNVTRIV